MENLVQLLIRKAYFYYQDKHYFQLKKQPLFNSELIKILDSAIKDPLLFFEGFETSLSIDIYGGKFTREREVWENFFLTEHHIYLNQHFLFNLLGYQNNNPLAKLFNFAKLIETIAHEVAHCLIYNLYQTEEEHGELHQKITNELEEYL
jgi:hypothetical protein